MAPVLGIGGSPSFCCRASAITKNARRPMFIRWDTDKAQHPYYMPESLFVKSPGNAHTLTSKIHMLEDATESLPLYINYYFKIYIQ